MTSPVIDKLTDAQTQVLDAIDQAREPVTAVVRQLAEAAERYVPNVTVPGGDKLPTADELIANQFDFAGKLLEHQRTFVEAVVDAAKPVSAKLSVVEDAGSKRTKGTSAAA